MMTISDIYDALSAHDRPYKKAVPWDQALDILHDEAKQGLIDGYFATSIPRSGNIPPDRYPEVQPAQLENLDTLADVGGAFNDFHQTKLLRQSKLRLI
jgi:hypothetical protein